MTKSILNQIISCAKTHRGEQRREALLKAARLIFLEKGFAGTSLDDVIKITGGSKASVYKYFGNKDGLFAAMFAERCQVFLAHLDIPQGLSDNLEHTLTQFAQRVLESAIDVERIALIRALATEADRFPQLAEMAYNTGPKYVLDLLASLIKRHHDAGLLVCPRPDIAAMQFMETIKAHAQWRTLLGLPAFANAINADDYIHIAVTNFLRAYQP
ncbi:MAG TPA: TetR/AcrR family transcriptional regulator [Agitococcus sp.]|nr:TetR/AcrR family transcriptional regulator [Agitococcus sp.]HMX99926.1 TetR/AcrR family transcriptional regulator [Agitococcus sp.]HMY28194.1 TetR/AcrR family transcriptional regulator [Agitococcus sp.]HMY82377.1 TetR/AcrR family transcriptional regulator [Agitococcus sp.]HNA20787.1 TetR/AcrR family transcriptional regulator [Agitococcus sp.]